MNRTAPSLKSQVVVVATVAFGLALLCATLVLFWPSIDVPEHMTVTSFGEFTVHTNLGKTYVIEVDRATTDPPEWVPHSHVEVEGDGSIRLLDLGLDSGERYRFRVFNFTDAATDPTPEEKQMVDEMAYFPTPRWGAALMVALSPILPVASAGLVVLAMRAGSPAPPWSRQTTKMQGKGMAGDSEAPQRPGRRPGSFAPRRSPPPDYVYHGKADLMQPDPHDPYPVPEHPPLQHPPPSTASRRPHAQARTDPRQRKHTAFVDLLEAEGIGAVEQGRVVLLEANGSADPYEGYPGRFLLRVDRPEFRVRVEAPGYHAQTVLIQAAPPDDEPGKPYRTGQVVQEVRLHPAPRKHRVVVRGADTGRPVPGVAVWLRTGDELVDELRTGPDGAVTITALPGCIVQTHAGIPCFTDQAKRLHGDVTLELRFHLEPTPVALDAVAEATEVAREVRRTGAEIAPWLGALLGPVVEAIPTVLNVMPGWGGVFLQTGTDAQCLHTELAEEQRAFVLLLQDAMRDRAVVNELVATEPRAPARLPDAAALLRDDRPLDLGILEALEQRVDDAASIILASRLLRHARARPDGAAGRIALHVQAAFLEALSA